MGSYDYVCDIGAMVFGIRDAEITLFQDFECSIEVEVDPDGVNLVTVTGVFVEGRDLAYGDALAQAIRIYVMGKAEADIRNGDGPWDKIREDYELTQTGPDGSPDEGWTFG